MKKWMLIAIGAILVLGGSGTWFWLLGSAPKEAPRTVTLETQESNVTVRRPDATIWEPADPGMELGEGWSVKTDAKGIAVIRFWGQGESRLQSNSEVTITKAMIDADDPTKVNVLLKLDAGRVWSRVLKLFDIGSSYAVQTNAVVATVRGTAFDVAANPDGSSEIWVNRSAVDVAPSQGIRIESPLALAEGYSAIFSADGLQKSTSSISVQTKDSNWFRLNERSDESFVNNEKDRLRSELAKLGGAGPDSLLYGFTRASEDLHLAFAQEGQKDALASRYLTRRFARLIDLVLAGKTGLAAQEFARLETYVRTQLRGSDAVRERRRIKIAISRVAILIADADPDSPLYAFKQRFEDLAEALQEGDGVSLLYVRMLAVDARLDEASRFRRTGNYQSGSLALNVAKTAITNITRESEAVLPTASKDARRALRGKLAGLIAREGAERAALMAAMIPAPAEGTTTSTDDGTATSTSLLGAPSTERPTSTPTGTVVLPQGPQYASIALYIQPNPVSVGQAANLIVEASASDGSKTDVSAKSTFTIVNGVGSLNGPTLTPSQQGTVTVQATYNDNGTQRTASATVTAQGQITLDSLALASSQGTVINTTKNPTTQIISSASYSNGYNKAVTAQTSYQVLTPGAGSMNGSYFTAASNYTGSAEIEGSFTENGSTVVGSITLTIR